MSMQIGKIKPVATIVAQFAAGVEVEAIQHEGKLFLPVTTMGDFASKESAPEVEDDVEETEKPSKKSAASSAIKVYSEDELMEMDVKEMKKILKELGIDPDDFDGKNTNKKLRKLIIDAQAGSETSDDEDDDDEKPAKKSKTAKKDDSEDDDDDDDVIDKVADILDEYDGGKINTKKATTKLTSLLSAPAEKVSKLLDAFDDDDDVDIDTWAKKFVKKFATVEDDDDDEDEKSSKKKKAGKKDKSSKNLVEIEDLQKGDRVNVYWADKENMDWYKGTVKSVKGDKVTIAYDDDTEDVLDPEVNTEIELLDEE